MAPRLAFAGSIVPLGAALALLPFLACSSFSGDAATGDASAEATTESDGGTGANAPRGDADTTATELFVQSTRSDPKIDNATTARFDKAIGDGTFLAVFAYALGDHDLSITDTDDNTYVPLAAVKDDGAGSGRWFYCERAKKTGNPDTIVLDVGSSSVTGLIAFELRVRLDPSDTAPVFEDDTYVVASNTGALASPEITTGADQSLVLAAAWSAADDHVPFEPGAGFTELARDETFFYLLEYELVGPGKHVATATFPPDLDWGMAVAGFRRTKAP